MMSHTLLLLDFYLTPPLSALQHLTSSLHSNLLLSSPLLSYPILFFLLPPLFLLSANIFLAVKAARAAWKKKMDVELSQQWELERMQMKSKLAWILFLFMPLFPAVYILSKCILNFISVLNSYPCGYYSSYFCPHPILIPDFLNIFDLVLVRILLSRVVVEPLLNHYLFIPQ
jgi:hypothetical protein